MAINTALLNKICTTPGAPGFEKEIRALVLKEIKGLVDEVEIDNMGNVYAIKRGTGDKRVMIGAHMDEIGFMVTHIDDNGFIRFHTLGGFDPKTLTAQRVIIELKDKVLKIYDIDEVAPSGSNTNKDEALSALEVLGFAKKQSGRIVEKIISGQPDANVETIIKEALKNL